MMNKREKETLIVGMLTIIALIGDIFFREVFSWVWMIGVGALFLLFALVHGDDKPKKIERK